MTPEELAQVKQDWHWLYDHDGELQEHKVLAELHDYKHLLEQASKVYWSITGGRLSKTNHYADNILYEHEAVVEEMLREARLEGAAQAITLKNDGITDAEILTEMEEDSYR